MPVLDTAGRGDGVPCDGWIIKQEKERLQRYAITEYDMCKDDIVYSKDDFQRQSRYTLEDDRFKRRHSLRKRRLLEFESVHFGRRISQRQHC